MRVVIVGAGGVGSAVATVAAGRQVFREVWLADVDAGRAVAAAERTGDDRFRGVGVDASNRADLVELFTTAKADAVLNACDPRFNMAIFDAALAAGCHYIDMAASLSERHAERPYELPGVVLGDDQFARHDDWLARERLAIVGLGIEPGFSDVVARYAADHLFSEIDEIGVRDGADLVVDGYEFAPTFSIWTTIEECLNPPVVFERDRGLFCTEPFSEPEVFVFPEGIGPVECVNVEHEEVPFISRHVDAGRVTFKYGLGDRFIEVLRTLHLLGLDGTEPIDVRGQMVSPRDVVAAALPNPANLGDRMHGKTCAGVYVTGRGTDGRPRSSYLYHVADNDECMARWGHQAVVWQTAVNPIVGLELLAEGVWGGAGVLVPEQFEPRPFLDRFVDVAGPWGHEDREGS